MNKSLVLASLVAVVALAACGKKEEAPVAATAPGGRDRACRRRRVSRGQCRRRFGLGGR